MAFGSQHPEWSEFETRMRARIDALLLELGNPAMNIDDTNFTRGRIAEIRELLAEQTSTPGAQPARY